MPYARTVGVFLGTSETVGVTIATGATTISAEVDVLGDSTSYGFLDLYLCFTSTTTIGTIDVRLDRHRVTGAGYAQAHFDAGSVTPIVGTRKVWLGRFPASRYMTVSAKNNATLVDATNVFVGYELVKVS